ncbi:hypothetical protein JOB18_024076 [Solea senegalensis]|uniref:Secretory calcium-binding phosphoprotein 9 n=1 Tax=Solea senegalensis TaxID=28829 RepID=A0AAV6Q7M6_SOLSE|nr:elastin-like [Solea senegalensis]XP_043885200.1 elastin-like [Solea senegalensis]KAG7486062.1 hypothetical protein JOB18_024312 [Solea senegalensis]KAG7507094.1 hypothetical protein JOB18_024076 [Solea senegalensis]
MKLLLLTTVIVTISNVSAGKTQRMLAAMMAGMNGGTMAGMNGGMLAGMNGGMLAGMNGGIVNPALIAGGLNPALIAGGLNLPVVPGGGAGFVGQPQFVQVVPRVPAFALPAPVPNVYPVPAVNTLPLAGFPQMAAMNPPQQPQMGFPGVAMQQQLPPQPDPLRRFRRQIMKQGNNMKITMDTQIPAPTDSTTTTLCDEDGQHVDN